MLGGALLKALKPSQTSWGSKGLLGFRRFLLFAAFCWLFKGSGWRGGGEGFSQDLKCKIGKGLARKLEERWRGLGEEPARSRQRAGMDLSLIAWL